MVHVSSSSSDKVMLTAGSSTTTKLVVHPSFFLYNNVCFYIYLEVSGSDCLHFSFPLFSFAATVRPATADKVMLTG